MYTSCHYHSWYVYFCMCIFACVNAFACLCTQCILHIYTFNAFCKCKRIACINEQMHLHVRKYTYQLVIIALCVHVYTCKAYAHLHNSLFCCYHKFFEVTFSPQITWIQPPGFNTSYLTQEHLEPSYADLQLPLSS